MSEKKIVMKQPHEVSWIKVQNDPRSNRGNHFSIPFIFDHDSTASLVQRGCEWLTVPRDKLPPQQGVVTPHPVTSTFGPVSSILNRTHTMVVFYHVEDFQYSYISNLYLICWISIRRSRDASSVRRRVLLLFQSCMELEMSATQGTNSQHCLSNQYLQYFHIQHFL